MTHNIAGCPGGIDKVATVINAQNPDIVLLQEVKNGMPLVFVSDGKDQAAANVESSLKKGSNHG